MKVIGFSQQDVSSQALRITVVGAEMAMK